MKPNKKSTELLNTLRNAIDLHNRGQLDQADAIYRKVLQGFPNHPDALHLRALICHAKGDYPGAANLAEQAIAVAPQTANFYNTSGDALRLSGKMKEAQRRLEQATTMSPTMAIAHNNLSLAYSANGDPDRARQANRKALALDPNHVDTQIQALRLALRENNSADATYYTARLRAQPPQARIQSVLSLSDLHGFDQLIAAGQFDAARNAAQRARLTHPPSAEAWRAIGVAGDLDCGAAQAELNLTIAANLAPGAENVRLALAHHLKERKHLAEAESHYLAWLEKRPDDPAARFGHAGVLLSAGDYARGWVEYEARWQLPQQPAGRFEGAPQWQGEAVTTLLLYAEQGLGDSLQMLRFLPLVLARGVQKIVLIVPAALERLLKRNCPENVSVLTAPPADQAFDAACPLMSLPLILQANSAQDLTMSAPYLKADPERSRQFAQKLNHLGGRKLGIIWRGGNAGGVNYRRAVPEESLRPLLDLPGWTAVSLQFGEAPAIAGVRLFDLAAEIADFDDLAAAMSCMDAVVCVDTGPAHLAGALGLRCYTLVPWLHDWRWEIDGAETLWYPSMTLIRQFSGTSWTPAIADLVSVLTSVLSAGPASEVRPQIPASPEQRIIEENLFPFVVAACRHGSFKLPLFDRYITLSLLAYGEYSAREVELLSGYLRAGDTVLDVGANLGAVCVPLAHAVGPTGRVIAFEPQQMIHDCLADTIKRNALSWVELRQQAVGRKAGECRIAHTDPRVPDNYGGVSLSKAKDGDRVSMISIDQLNLERCRLIKVDVEGAELDVLSGALETIRRCRPILHVEGDRHDMRKALVDLMRANGYTVYLHEPPLYAEKNFRNCDVNLFPSLVSGNLLGLPAGEIPPGDAVRLA